MPARKKSTADKLKTIAKKHGCLTVEPAELLFCTTCADNVAYDIEHLSSRVAAHFASKTHRQNEKKRNEDGVSQPTLTALVNFNHLQTEKHEEFCRDLAATLVKANIPIHKIECAPFADFLKKYTKHSLPSANNLRYKHVALVYKQQQQRIREEIGNQDICIMIDETNDRCDRNQINVLISPLNGKPTKSRLFNVEFVDKCDSAAIFKVFTKTCCMLWGAEDQPYNRVKLFVSDQAAYMLLAGKLIKNLCSDMLHITCLAHCLNRVAETVRDQHPLVDKFLASFKEILRSNLARKNKFREMTKLPLPPKPVITRWTTWLKAAEFACINLEKIKPFIDSLKSDAGCVRSAQQLIANEELTREFLSLSDFFFLIEATLKLQTQCLRLDDSIALMLDVGRKLDEANLSAPSAKFTASLEKNPDMQTVACNKELAFKLRMKFAPLVSADVERSFSTTKRILTPERSSFEEDNLRMHYVIAYNAHFE